jgi:hypothetical protein
MAKVVMNQVVGITGRTQLTVKPKLNMVVHGNRVLDGARETNH